MHRGPYRHSVWIDVLGVMFAGAVLLGGAGYLLYNAGGAVNGSSSNFSRGSGSASPVQGHRSARPSRSSGGGTARGEAANPLLSSRSNSAPSGARASGAASGGGAPFSKSWRSNATPSLTGPPASSGNASPGRAGDASSRADGFSGASPRTSGRSGGGNAQSGGSNVSSGSGWRAEAQRLGGTGPGAEQPAWADCSRVRPEGTVLLERPGIRRGPNRVGRPHQPERTGTASTG